MYANRVLFSDQLFAAYQAFMRTLFAMYASTDADAPLRVPIADILGERRNLSWWDDTTLSYFTTADPASLDEVYDAYDLLGQRFRADLYVTHTGDALLTEQPRD